MVLVGGVFAGGGVGLLALFVGEAGGFDGPVAEEAPAAGDHGFDEVELVLGDGEEVGDVGGEEGVEALFGFAGEDDGVGEENEAAQPLKKRTRRQEERRRH